jgi:4,5-dihydroxyphthalate decarboxylase
LTAAREFEIYGGDYEHTLSVAGSYDGIDLRYRTMRVQDIFSGMLESARFEICEFSLANYIVLRAAGQDWLAATPVFPSRAFRHSLAVTRRESPLTRLESLAGTRIGVEDYSMTAAVWFRGLLHDEYGIDAGAIRWVSHEKQRFAFPAGANVETTTSDLEELLCAGEIDAMLAFTLKDSGRPTGERRLRTVLQNPTADEQAYYRRTSIFPISHCVVIRHDVLEGAPGVAAAVFAAYTHAKDAAYRRQLGTSLIPWSKAHWSSTFEFFGGDPLPYGLTANNRHVVERLAQYLVQQGFIPAAPHVDALFA